MGVWFSYNLVGRGWADCSLQVGDQMLEMTASYISDALSSLLHAALDVVRGVPDVTALFEEEPGEYRWRLLPVPPDQVRIRILWMKDNSSRLRDSRGELLFDAQCRLRTFAGAVLANAQALLREHGLQGYLDLWGHEFPLDLQERLKQALSGGDQAATVTRST